MFILFRRKERVALVLIGILLVAFAAGLSAATARSVQGAFDIELARHWRTDYDLVVRHPGAVSESELLGQSVAAKFQSNHFPNAGITWAQLAKIRSIAGVEVAAPLAVVGPAYMEANVGVPLPYQDLLPGVYKEEIVIVQNNGIEEVPIGFTRFFLVQNQYDEEEFYQENWIQFRKANLSIPPYQNRFGARPYLVNIVAVDFEAEAALHGLDKALIAGSLPVPGTYSIYKSGDTPIVPIVINSAYGPTGHATGRLTKLVDLEPTLDTVDMLAESAHNIFIQSRQQHIKDFTLDLEVPLSYPKLGDFVAMCQYLAPEALQYNNINGQVSLEALHLGGALGVNFKFEDVHGAYELIGKNQWFRPITLVEGLGSPRFGWRSAANFELAGLFDPGKLSLSPADSPVAAPMETYRASAEKILRGINGATVLGNTYAQNVHPFDFVGTPIGGLIPIQDALQMDDVSINSVRVKVSDVDDMGEASQLRIAYVAKQIRELTGLHVDIVLGSSQERRPVYLYSYNNSARENYIQTVKDALAETVQRIEAKTGLPVRIEFITNDDLIDNWSLYGRWLKEGPRPVIYEPLLYHYGDTISDIASPVFKELGYDEFYIGARMYNREIVIMMPEYQFSEDESRDLYGVVEQYWIKLGAGLRIYEETNRGTFWITLALLAVGALFIGNTTYISAVGRIGEFSVLRSLGWRRSTVFRVSLFETLLISFLAGLVTAGVLALVWHFSDRYMEPWVLLLAAPVVILTFLLGSIPPLVRTIFIPPLQGSRQGELKSGTRIGGAGRFGFVLRGLALRPGRSFVTILAMIIPGGTLAFIFFIYFGIQSVLGETMLGEYLAVDSRATTLSLTPWSLPWRAWP